MLNRQLELCLVTKQIDQALKSSPEAHGLIAYCTDFLQFFHFLGSSG